MIPPIFESQGDFGTDDFFEGVALVRVGGQSWYINELGKKLFRGRNSGRFSNNLAVFREGAKNGYLNSQGGVAIAPTFDSAHDFSEGLAAVANGGKSGYINEKSQVVISLGFALALPFTNGVARVIKQGGCVYVGYGPCDRFNAMVLPVKPNNHQEAAIQEPHCLYSFIDRTGHELFADQFREAKDFAEGVAPVGNGTNWGYVDRHGRLVIPMQYSDAEPFAEGLAAVQIRGKWGYADHAGKLVIPATFAHAFSFSESVALTIDDYWQYRFIDKSGRQAVPGVFEGASDFAMGLAHVRNGTRYDEMTWAYIDHSGHAVFRYK